MTSSLPRKQYLLHIPFFLVPSLLLSSCGGQDKPLELLPVSPDGGVPTGTLDPKESA